MAKLTLKDKIDKIVLQLDELEAEIEHQMEEEMEDAELEKLEATVSKVGASKELLEQAVEELDGANS